MLYPFILTLLAGLSTMIGTLPIFVNFKNEKKLIASACSFAAGVMIAVSILDLIPTSINYLRIGNNNGYVILLCFIFIILGIILATLLDSLVDKISTGNNLFNVGILSMIVIILHNIPEGISIAIPIYYSTKSKIKAIIYTLISALSEFFGAILTYLFLSHFISNNVLGFILALTAGIMIAISFEKLIPTGNNYNNKLTKIFSIIGFIFMIISLLLNNLIS